VLPASFGQIQLGETFSSCLSVNNEATVDVEDVHLIVEMQTATTKVKVAEFGGPQAKARLGPAGTMECVVSHEIKELGQHVLACTVAYRTPANIRPVGPTENGLQSFRKFYKFAVCHC
jgi:trafficking protein particle complex subunit 13